MALHHTAENRAAALFASDLSRYCRPSRADVAAAIGTAMAAQGGVRGCLGEVAAAYGEHPETAVLRMRWARQTIEAELTADKHSARSQLMTLSASKWHA
jgi:hypothetical protein